MNSRRSFLRNASVAAFASATELTWAQAIPLWESSGDSNSSEMDAIDAGRFARVVTSDPTRMDGARASRTEEYRAEDVFLETDVPASADGTYVAPTAQNGMACIGLNWYERRSIITLELRFADGSHVPSPADVRVQAWVGTPHYGVIAPWETLWQGRWVSLPGPIQTEGNRWHLPIDLKTIPDAHHAIQKIRWIFPPSTQKVAIGRPIAFTNDTWDNVELQMEIEQSTGKHALIQLYNGVFLDPIARAPIDWDGTRPMRLKVRYVKKPAPPGSTRTLIWLKFPDSACAVSVDDVLEHGCVNIPAVGLLVTRADAATSPSAVRKQIADKKTILERVRELPDQTLAQAMDRSHRPQLDTGPMLLSLACHNAKWILETDGTVLDGTSNGLRSTLGRAEKPEFTTQLHGGWLPVPTRTNRDGGLVYRQTTFVAPHEKDGPAMPLPWLNCQPLALVQYSVENSSPRPAEAFLEFRMETDWAYQYYFVAAKRSAWLAKKRPSLPLRRTSEGALIEHNGRLLAYFYTGETSPLQTEIEGSEIRVKGVLPPGARVECWAYLPHWEMNAEDYSQLRNGHDLLQEVEAYWAGILNSGTQIEVPDTELMNLSRASQVHGLIACRNEGNGERIEQWGASMAYKGLNALYYIIPAMETLGNPDFARRALEYYIPRYTTEGLLSDGYTLAGVGWHLELVWNHYLFTRDLDWLKKVSPEIERACWWIVRQREKTKKFDADGNKLPEYGLCPPGLIADWGAYNYYFSLIGYFFAGLQAGVKALERIEYEDVGTLQEHMVDFRKEILRAYRWAQGRMPVNQLRNGTWVQPYPSQVPLPGTMGLFFPAVNFDLKGKDDDWDDSDYYRPLLGCYDVELGAHNMVPLGVLDANGEDVRCMLDHMEDFWFLADGFGSFPAAASEKDWFNLGGFSKVQPNLCRVAEIYALRDDVKPFIRSYFNFIAPQLNKQNLTFWEGLTPDVGTWGSTEGGGYFLLLTRIMLVREQGDVLWLAPFITDQWLKDGASIILKNASTHFGPVSYCIRSAVKSGFIEAKIEAPTRTPPKELLLRLRHPEGKRIMAVKVEGAPHKDFDPSRDIIRLQPSMETIHVIAEY